LNKKVYHCPLTDKELISQQQAQLAIQGQQIKLLEEKVMLLLSQIQSRVVANIPGKCFMAQCYTTEI